MRLYCRQSPLTTSPGAHLYRLWSFLIARSDPNQDGLYSPTERRALLASLGTSFTFNTLRAHVPRRTTLSSTLKPTIFDHTGLERPKQTTYAFTSADGYALFESNADVELGEHGRWPTFGSSLDEDERDSQPPIKDESSPCEVDLKECVGEGFMSQEGEVEVTAVMKRVAFERPRCGDCMIVQLFAQSGSRGFEAFLPLPGNGEGDNAEQDGEETAEGSEESVMAVGLQKEWQNVDYRPLGGSAHTLRQQVIPLPQSSPLGFGTDMLLTPCAGRLPRPSLLLHCRRILVPLPLSHVPQGYASSPSGTHDRPPSFRRPQRRHLEPRRRSRDRRSPQGMV